MKSLKWSRGWRVFVGSPAKPRRELKQRRARETRREWRTALRRGLLEPRDLRPKYTVYEIY